MTHSSIPNESSAAEKRMRPFNIFYDEKRCGYFVQGSGFDLFLYFTGDEPEIFLECDDVAPMAQSGGYRHWLQFRLWCETPSIEILETLVYRELVKFFPEQF